MPSEDVAPTNGRYGFVALFGFRHRLPTIEDPL
jgi:hypothetical protein